MKTVVPFLALLFIASYHLQAQTEFELRSDQSMLMYGKGPGQDATINPYKGEDCYAIVENFGEVAFSIRIQQDGQIIETIPVAGKETKKVKLLADYELYLDVESEGVANARVGYEPIEPE